MYCDFRIYKIYKIFIYLLISIILSSKGTKSETNTETDGSQYIQRYEIGDSCNGNNVCNSDRRLLTCVVQGIVGTCYCNDLLAIQVDFVGYSISKTCLIRNNVPCNQRSSLNLREMKAAAEKIKNILANISSNTPDSRISYTVTEAHKNLRMLYGKELDNRPWNKFLEEYFHNFTVDVDAYLKKHSGFASVCSSGRCAIDNKCTIGVHPAHRISNKRRKFRLSRSMVLQTPAFSITILQVLTFQYLIAKIHG